MKNRLCKAVQRALAITLALALILLVPSWHAEADEDIRSCFRLAFQDDDMKVSGAVYKVYKVADCSKDLKRRLSDAMSPCAKTVDFSIILDDAASSDAQKMAETVKGAVIENNIAPDFVLDAAEDGSCECECELGVYLIVPELTRNGDYLYSGTPFFVTVPYSSEDGDLYQVTAKVKVEKEYVPVKPDDPFDPDDPGNNDDPSSDYTFRRAIKVWDDEGYETLRPESIKANLYCDGVLQDTQELNNENGWCYVWGFLEKGHDWTVTELPVNGYYVTASRTGNTVVLTNEYSEEIIGCDPAVEKKIVGDTPKQKSEFRFLLKADNNDCPMPAGSENGEKTISIWGAGDGAFGAIAFTKPGQYKYTISEIDRGAGGYTYDKNMYTLTYDVKKDNNVLTYDVTAIDKDGNKVISIVFVNNYDADGELPWAGTFWLPAIGFAVVGIALVIIGYARKRRAV